MKETRYFFAPDAAVSNELPDEEAVHATRVLRLQPGDEIMLMDGKGVFYRAEVTIATKSRCVYKIVEAMPQQPQWNGHLHLAIAPTKMMDRIEWMAEKATEVGFDEISLLNCKFSERRAVKTSRLEKIIVSAAKQSRKGWKPVVNEIEPFNSFVAKDFSGMKYIAHCYDEVERVNLYDELCELPDDSDILVLIGPEGDFSIDEVQKAVSLGFKSVDLGKSRLRTETAGLSAVMMMQLSKQ